jgi:serine protein kinase
MGAGLEILDRISRSQRPNSYRQEHWQGSFSEYLDLVRKTPAVTRTAYQRLHDMVISYGTYPVEGSKEGLIRYRFFDDPRTTAMRPSSGCLGR